VAIVIAVTDKGASKRGMSAFIVPTDAPGYTVARLEDKLGQHSVDTAQINYLQSEGSPCRCSPLWPSSLLNSL
jgi:alkylation response protein AidB-like acyl-CoA dehydrogenase